MNVTKIFSVFVSKRKASGVVGGLISIGYYCRSFCKRTTRETCRWSFIRPLDKSQDEIPALRCSSSKADVRKNEPNNNAMLKPVLRRDTVDDKNNLGLISVNEHYLQAWKIWILRYFTEIYYVILFHLCNPLDSRSFLSQEKLFYIT